MKYDAATIDTSIFDRYHLNLNSGMLGQLHQFNQFGSGMPQFVLSEIVVRELHRHLTIRVQKARDTLSNAIQKGGETGFLNAKQVTDLTAIYTTSKAPMEVATDLFSQFAGNVGCESISAGEADMKRLISMYFEAIAPFEDSEKKK